MSTPEDPRLDPAYQAWLAERAAAEPVQPEPEPQEPLAAPEAPPQGLSDHPHPVLRQHLPLPEPAPDTGHAAAGHDGLGVGVSN